MRRRVRRRPSPLTGGVADPQSDVTMPSPLPPPTDAPRGVPWVRRWSSSSRRPRPRPSRGMLGPDFIVESSIGHIRDLPRGADEVPAAYKGEAWARLGVDVDNGFKPLYVVSSAEEVAGGQSEEAAQGAPTSSTSPRTRTARASPSPGTCSRCCRRPCPVKRMVFHEITRPAIARAVDEWRDLDRRLVDAQEARRILDRLYGYEVSPVLWRRSCRGCRPAGSRAWPPGWWSSASGPACAFRSATWWGIDGTFTADAEAPAAATSRADARRAVDGSRRGHRQGLRRDRGPDRARARSVVLGEDEATSLAAGLGRAAVHRQSRSPTSRSAARRRRRS